MFDRQTFKANIDQISMKYIGHNYTYFDNKIGFILDL